MYMYTYMYIYIYIYIAILNLCRILSTYRILLCELRANVLRAYGFKCDDNVMMMNSPNYIYHIYNIYILLYITKHTII